MPASLEHGMGVAFYTNPPETGQCGSFYPQAPRVFRRTGRKGDTCPLDAGWTAEL